MHKNIAVLGTTLIGIALVTGASVASAEMRGSVTAGASSTAEVHTQSRVEMVEKMGLPDGKRPGLAMGPNKEGDIKVRADKEIKRRIDALNKFSERMSAMVRVGGEDKSKLQEEIAAQIKLLTDLQVKISAETSTTSLKEQVKSITDSYRVYALVLPKVAITAAAARVNTLAVQMTTLGAKLEARLNTAETAGANISVAQTALIDYKAKVADAKIQADAAVSGIANLQPDSGDASIKATNVAALQAAHKKIQAAQQDLVAARKDVNTIRQNLPKVRVDAQATTTASTTVQ